MVHIYKTSTKITNNGTPWQIEIQCKAIHEDVDISNWSWNTGMAIAVNLCNIFFF